MKQPRLDYISVSRRVDGLPQHSCNLSDLPKSGIEVSGLTLISDSPLSKVVHQSYHPAASIPVCVLAAGQPKRGLRHRTRRIAFWTKCPLVCDYRQCIDRWCGEDQSDRRMRRNRDLLRRQTPDCRILARSGAWEYTGRISLTLQRCMRITPSAIRPMIEMHHRS